MKTLRKIFIIALLAGFCLSGNMVRADDEQPAQAGEEDMNAGGAAPADADMKTDDTASEQKIEKKAKNKKHKKHVAKKKKKKKHHAS